MKPIHQLAVLAAVAAAPLAAQATEFTTLGSLTQDEFNLLVKDPGRPGPWRGSLYCERGPAGTDLSPLRRQFHGKTRHRSRRSTGRRW